MESLQLNLQSKNEIVAYIADHSFARYEKAILNEMLEAIDNGNQQQLDWFLSFGDSFRSITMNVNAYRKGLEFGYTEIAFTQYGWFQNPVLLDKETIKLGDSERYGEYSTIDLGHGPNGIWTYALHYSYGVAGGGYGLSVYGKQFSNREVALTVALNELKAMFTKKIGSTDTTNDKQPVIMATLRAIVKEQNSLVQLSLF